MVRNFHIAATLCVVCVSFVFFAAPVRAQYGPPINLGIPISECDYCGCAQGISPLETGATGVRIEYSTLDLNAQYAGSQKQPNPSNQYEVLQTERTSLYYRFAGSAFTASLEIPYVERHSSVLQDDPTLPLYTSGASGLGDVIGRMRYTVQQYIDESTLAYSASFGVQLPTGRTNIAPPGGGFLDPDLEPGAGTTNLLIGGNAFWSFDRIGFGVNANVGILTGKGAPEDSGQYHKYGNFLNGEINFRYRILPVEISESNLSVTLAIGAETRAHETQGGQDIAASGGTLVFVSPGLKYIISQGIAADASFHIPIYEYFNWDPVAGDTQFGETYRFVAGLQFSL
jgi:hypothetical protein